MSNHRWRVQLFGVLKISLLDETTTRFRTQMTGALLAYLAYSNGRPQPREVLIDHLWPDIDIKQGRQRLSNALWSLRLQLERPGSGAEVFHADKFTVALNPAIFETDVAAFQNALKRARRATDSPTRRSLLEEAISYYGGDFLSGRYESWLVTEQDRLREQYEQAKQELESLGDKRADSGISHSPVLPVVHEIPSPYSTSQHYDTPMLPPTYTRFFGRQEELERLTQALAPTSSVSLITLTGIGGIGKTRLAQEAAGRMQDAFMNRVWFVPLAELHEPEHLFDTIRDTLRLSKDLSHDPMEQCVTCLSVAPSLLVLDNMEQFVAEGRAAILLQSLRDRVPTLKCLVTSRQLLGIVGERAVPVGALVGSETETSLHLFEDRARAVQPDFRVIEANRSIILRLCSVLDGIPLAIELAAARVVVISPAHMLSQMEARFTILRSRRRDVPERHRSLWAAIDSSYQLLTPEVQRFFVCLSVFRGGWTLESARAICCDGEQGETSDAFELTLDAIAELQESSLIFIGAPNKDADRFYMLDTLREYAAEQLSKQEDHERVRQQHARYFADIAIEAEPFLKAGATGQQSWLDKLQRDHDNLRLVFRDDNIRGEPVLRAATALHRFWLIRGHVQEGRRYLQSALEVNNARPESELAVAQNALGVLALTGGALNEAREHFEHAKQHYEPLGEQESIAMALSNCGSVAAQSGDFVAARNYYEQSLTLYRAVGNSLRQSMVLTNLGAILVYLDDYDAARKVLEECIPIQKTAGDHFTLWRTLQNLAEVALRQDDLGTAAKALGESLAIRRALGDQGAFGDTLTTASVIIGKGGKMQDACVAFAAAQSLRIAADTVACPANAGEEASWFEHIKSSLPKTTVDEMCQIGHVMSFEQATSYVENLLSDLSFA